MSSAVFDVAREIPRRLREIDILLGAAERAAAKDDNDLYNAICRAVSVLLAANLEGFIKDFSSSVVMDLNFYYKFADMPNALKRSFCRRIAEYEGVQEKDIVKKTNELVAFFGKNPVQIDLVSFKNNQNENKNPASKVIEKKFEKIGVDGCITAMCGDFEVIFGDDDSKRYIHRRKIIRGVSYFYAFPEFFGEPIQKFRYEKKVKETLWHQFIDGVLTRRHNIVHGDVSDNHDDVRDLRRDAEKLFFFMNMLMHSVCTYFQQEPKG